MCAIREFWPDGFGMRQAGQSCWEKEEPTMEDVQRHEWLTTVGLTGKQTAPCGSDGAHKMWVLVYRFTRQARVASAVTQGDRNQRLLNAYFAYFKNF